MQYKTVLCGEASVLGNGPYVNMSAVHVVITALKGGGCVTAGICLSVSGNIKGSLVGSAANSALEPVQSS